MDKLSKLQALLPEIKVSETAESSPWSLYPKPTHLYEGTDSEDDEEIMRRGKMEQSQMPQSSWVPAGAETSGNSDDHGHQQRPAELSDYQLSLGQSALEGETFCPWLVIKKYPYAYVGNVNRDKVAKGFWDEGKLFDHKWDFFYIHRLQYDANQTAILLVTTKQFEAFLAAINRSLKLQLAIPSGGAGNVFKVTFDNYGTHKPRYLGRSTNKSMANNLHSAVPPSWFKPKNETKFFSTSSDRSIAAFKAKIDLIDQAQKGRKVVNAEKKKTERFAKQQSWNHSTKRVQRYLGLRQASHETQVEIAGAGLADFRFDCDTYVTMLKASIRRLADFDPGKPAPFDQESDVVFVCVDIEANERNSNQITEVGIATLDTRDIKSLAPGERGVNWLSKIRARHFRINEYKHITNSEFVSGCPGRFEFGKSEFVKLKDAPQAVANCFKPPFSNLDEKAVIGQNEPKRNIILVGHSVGADVTYLKSLGYDVHNLSNLQEIIDTALMWQALKRELSPRNLGSVLAEIGIAGWNLHNAGNDAVYTLQAMIGISVKQLHEREKQKKVKDQEKKTRVEDSVKEATQNALEREEGWSSGGENSDGGGPAAPAPPRTKKSIAQPPKKCSQYREGSWRAPAQNAGMNSYNQKTDSYWRSAVVSGNRPVPSNDSWGLVEQKISPYGYVLPSTTPTTSGISSSPSNDSWGQIQQQSWIQGASLPGTIPTPARQISAQSTENMDEVRIITPAPSMTTWLQGPILPSTVPTLAWSASTDTRKNADEAEQKTPALQQTPWGSHNSRQKNANGVRTNRSLHQRD